MKFQMKPNICHVYINISYVNSNVKISTLLLAHLLFDVIISGWYPTKTQCNMVYLFLDPLFLLISFYHFDFLTASLKFNIRLVGPANSFQIYLKC